jgi:hypothetical protein
VLTKSTAREQVRGYVLNRQRPVGTGANAAELGAGALLFVGRFGVVPESDERLTAARRAFCAGMVALMMRLPRWRRRKSLIAIEWPDVIRGGWLGPPAPTSVLRRNGWSLAPPFEWRP